MKSTRGQFSVIWGVVMSLVFIGVAYLIYFTPYLLKYNAINDPEQDQFIVLRTILAIVFFLYGIARGYRTYREWKTQKKETE